MVADSAYGARTGSHESLEGPWGGVDEPPHQDDAYYGDASSPLRAQATVVMILGTVVFLLSLVVLAAHLTEQGTLQDLFFGVWGFTTWIWIFFAVLAVLLIWILILLASAPDRYEQDQWYGEEPDEDVVTTPHQHEAYEQEEETPFALPGEAGAEDTISLRCPKCMNVFSLQDPGERPFRHACPHCEVQGIYNGP